MELVGVLAFATVDSEGAPQIRNISAIHYEPDALYFFIARGKNFCKELMEDGRVQILAYTKYKEMIRLSGKAYAVTENEQKKWMDIIFEDRLADVWICQMEKYRDYDKFVKCSKCELKAWCRGCPAVANGTSGNFYGADPQCWKTRNEITGEVLPC